MSINTREGAGLGRWMLLSTVAAGALAATAWNALALEHSRSSEVGELASLTHAQAVAGGAYGSCEELPPGHPPVGQQLPPGHPPVGVAPGDAASALPPGHPPIGQEQQSPRALPPAGGESRGALFEEPVLRDI